MKTTGVIAAIAAVLVLAGFRLPQSDEKHDQKPKNDWSQRCAEMMETCRHMIDESSSMGSGMMGRGMMRGMGMMGMMRMMRHGMMNGMMDRMHMSGHHRSDTKLSKPLDKEGAIEHVQEYVESLDNPRLKVGEAREDDGAFAVDIVTKKENAVVQRVKVAKETGELSPVRDE